MPKEQVIKAIKTGFAETPYPGSQFSQISATRHDEGIYEYFVDSDQFNHAVEDLRYHSCALSFFTDSAFRYWLPAFMIAELTEPVAADVVGESIAFHLSAAQGAAGRISEFSPSEINAVVVFLEECVDDDSQCCYREALVKIHKNTNEAYQSSRSWQSATRSVV